MDSHYPILSMSSWPLLHVFLCIILWYTSLYPRCSAILIPIMKSLPLSQRKLRMIITQLITVLPVSLLLSVLLTVALLWFFPCFPKSLILVPVLSAALMSPCKFPCLAALFLKLLPFPLVLSILKMALLCPLSDAYNFTSGPSPDFLHDTLPDNSSHSFYLDSRDFTDPMFATSLHCQNECNLPPCQYSYTLGLYVVIHL